MCATGSGSTVTWINGWSALARILPYSEQGNLFNSANFSIWKEDPQNSTTIGQTVGLLICPSEIQPQVSSHDYGLAGVTSYGVNQGDWFVWGGFNGPQNRNAFGMNRSRRVAEFIDGMSQTLHGGRGEDLPTGVELPIHAAAVGQQSEQHSQPLRQPVSGRARVRQRCLHDREPVRVPYRVVRRQRSRGRVHDGLAAQQGDHRPTGVVVRRDGSRPERTATRSSAARLSRRSTPAATTPAGSTPCWPMVRSGSSRARSTGWSGVPWGPSPAGRCCRSDSY